MSRASVSLHLVCPSCGHRSGESDRHCVRCGGALLLENQHTCPVCDHPLPPGQEPHCGRCGAYLRRSMRGHEHPARFPHRLLLAGLVLGLLAMAWQRANAPRQDSETLGGVAPGLGPSAVENRLGRPARRTDSRRFTGRDGREHVAETWLYGMSSTRVPGLVLVFLDGQVVQIGASRPDFPTGRGLGVGDVVPRAETLYGPGIETEEGGGIRAWRVRRGNTVLAAYFLGEEGAIVFLTLEGPHPAVLPDEDSDVTGQPDASPLSTTRRTVSRVTRPETGTSGTDGNLAARPGS